MRTAGHGKQLRVRLAVQSNWTWTTYEAAKLTQKGFCVYNEAEYDIACDTKVEKVNGLPNCQMSAYLEKVGPGRAWTTYNMGKGRASERCGASKVDVVHTAARKPGYVIQDGTRIVSGRDINICSVPLSCLEVPIFRITSKNSPP